MPSTWGWDGTAAKGAVGGAVGGSADPCCGVVKYPGCEGIRVGGCGCGGGTLAAPTFM